MRVVVLSDTHLHPSRRRSLPPAVYEGLEGAGAILHAGDIVTAEVLQELSRFATTYAVKGNNDMDPALATLPDTRVEVLEGVRIGMVHDSGPKSGREPRLRRRFPDADVVVFGHSHIPWDSEGVEGQLLFNPGSPTERRRQPHHTLGTLDLEDGRVVDHRIHVV